MNKMLSSLNELIQEVNDRCVIITDAINYSDIVINMMAEKDAAVRCHEQSLSIF